MALRLFIARSLPAIDAVWLNIVDRLRFTVFDDAATKVAARTALELNPQVVSEGIDSGAVNAAVVTLVTVTTFDRVVGSKVSFAAIATNTGAATLNVNGSGASPILAQDSTACTGGELFHRVTVIWTGAAWQIIAGGIPVANRRRSTEATAPTNYDYFPGDPRRWGAVGNDTVNCTAAFQAAFDSVVSTGDSINIAPGVYRMEGPVSSGPIDNKKTSVHGNGAVLKQYSSNENTLNIRNSQCEIINLRFETDAAVTPSNAVAAIDILDVSDVAITDCVFHNLATKGVAIRVDVTGNCNDISIKGCHFNNCSGTAVSANSEDISAFVRRVTIVGNTFQSPTSPVSDQTRAIHLVAGVTDVTIAANTCAGTALADYSQGWRDCFMIGNSSATQQPDRVMVTGNVITGMGDDGVGISGATNVTITGNVIHTSLVTSGVYVPGAGTWFNNQVAITNNVIHTCELAGIFLKDTKSYTITGNLIYSTQDGIYVNDNGVGILRGTISGNTIHTVERRGIYWDGGVCSCTGNVIDDFGDAGSGVESEKAAIFLNDTAAGSVISDNVIMNGIHGFVVTGNGTQFVVANNVVRSSNTGFGALFVAFTGGTFLMTDNILSAASGNFSGAPAVSATSVRDRNIPQLSTLTIFQALASGATVTPPQITANQNNYNPTGWLTSLFIRLSTDASRNVTGLGRDGSALFRMVRNVGAQNVVFTHEDAASTANQRINCPGGVNFTLTPSSGIWMIYDATIDRWTIIS